MSAKWQQMTIIITVSFFIIFSFSVEADALLTGLGYQILRYLDSADAVHHEISIDVDFDKQQAHFTNHFTVRAHKNMRQLYFLLGDGFEVKSVTTDDGKELQAGPYMSLGILPFTIHRATLDSSIGAGDEVTLKIEYYISQGTATYFFPFYRSNTFFVNIPMFWYPQMPTEGFFTAEISIDVPENYTVIGEGEPVEGTGKRTWRTVQPVPGLSLIAAEMVYDELDWDDRTLIAWREPTANILVLEMAEHTSSAVEYFEKKLGALLLERFDVVAMPFFIGGTNTQLSAIYFDPFLRHFGIDNELLRAYLIGHETAHKWLGFTAGFELLGTLWVAEGLVDYLSFLFIEYEYGKEAMREVIEKRAIEPLASHDRTRALNRIDIMDDDQEVAYQKGALVFRALHRRLGDEVFFSAIKEFIQQFTYQNATTSDFINVVEEVSGQNLNRFINDWVRGTHTLDYALKDVDVIQHEDGFMTSLKVVSLGRLTEPGKVDVLLILENGEEIWLEAVAGGQEITFITETNVMKIVLDPDYWTPDWERDNNIWYNKR